MGDTFDPSENQHALVSKTATPLPAKNPGDQEKIKKGFLRTIGETLGLLKSYTIEDLSRIKEAGVQEIELRPVGKAAEASKTVAEAAVAHARAEKLRSEAGAIEVKAKAEAAVAVINAISKIKQEGGSVGADAAELLRIINGVNKQESPQKTS